MFKDLSKNEPIQELIENGWTGAEGGMLCRSGPEGGIIDRNPVLDKWFVIFNDSRVLDEWFDTQDDAIQAFLTTKETDMIRIMDKVIVRDADNWYDGREALVKDRNEIAGVTVLWVAVDNTEFAVQESKVERI